MADDGEIYTEKRALDRIDMYNKKTWLNNQSVGDKIMLFGREYPIGEDGHIHVPTEDFWTKMCIRDRNNALDISYNYDVRGQLLEERRNGASVCYAYDKAGTVSYTHLCEESADRRRKPCR